VEKKKKNNHDNYILPISSALLYFASVKMMGNVFICNGEDILSQEVRLNLDFNFSFRGPHTGMADGFVRSFGA
jgi:hypothetical protein